MQGRSSSEWSMLNFIKFVKFRLKIGHVRIHWASQKSCTPRTEDVRIDHLGSIRVESKCFESIEGRLDAFRIDVSPWSNAHNIRWRITSNRSEEQTSYRSNLMPSSRSENYHIDSIRYEPLRFANFSLKAPYPRSIRTIPTRVDTKRRGNENPSRIFFPQGRSRHFIAFSPSIRPIGLRTHIDSLFYHSQNLTRSSHYLILCGYKWGCKGFVRFVEAFLSRSGRSIRRRSRATVKSTKL